MRTARAVLAAAAAVLVLAGCSKGRPMDLPAADSVGYETVAEMAAASTFVVEATVTTTRTKDVGTFGVTVCVAEVAAVHAGDVAVGVVVDVISAGGRNGYRTDNDLDEGTTYLMFLTDRHDPDYFPLNPTQGIYLVEDGDYVPIDDDNEVNVTPEDLAAL